MAWSRLMVWVLVLVFLVFNGKGTEGQQLDRDDDLSSLAEEMMGNFETAITDWLDRCRANVGDEAVEDIMKSIPNFTKCAQRVIVWSKLEREINRSIPRGELDLVFKKYCGRRDRIMACIEDVYTKLERCLNDQEKHDFNITRKGLDHGIDFVCDSNGDKIALFIAEDGKECVDSQKENIADCVEEKIPEIKDVELDSKNMSLSLFILNEGNCKRVNLIHQCIVEHTEKCSDPTPSNILDSLIKQVLKKTPCWQTSSAPTLLSHNDYLLPHLLTLLVAALTAANILL